MLSVGIPRAGHSHTPHLHCTSPAARDESGELEISVTAGLQHSEIVTGDKYHFSLLIIITRYRGKTNFIISITDGVGRPRQTPPVVVVSVSV